MPARFEKLAIALASVSFALGALVFMAPAAAATDDLAGRRELVAKMQPDAQQELLRKQDRFNALPKEEQDRLRALQAQIDADPKSNELHKVLKGYHEWLKTLTPTQRSELADLPPQERVEQIKRIQKMQQITRERAHQAELLTRQDVHEVIKWAENFAWKHREKILAHMSDNSRKFYAKSEGPRQKQALLHALVFDRVRRGGTGGGGGGNSGAGLVEQEDIDRLAAKLSEPAKKELTEAGDLAAQRKKVVGWIGTSLRLEAWQGPRRYDPRMGEDITLFLQRNVPADKRERLMTMPRDEMREEMLRMYFQRERADFGAGAGEFPWLEGKPGERTKAGNRGPGRPQRDDDATKKADAVKPDDAKPANPKDSPQP